MSHSYSFHKHLLLASGRDLKLREQGDQLWSELRFCFSQPYGKLFLTAHMSPLIVWKKI